MSRFIILHFYHINSVIIHRALATHQKPLLVLASWTAVSS